MQNMCKKIKQKTMEVTTSVNSIVKATETRKFLTSGKFPRDTLNTIAMIMSIVALAVPKRINPPF